MKKFSIILFIAILLLNISYVNAQSQDARCDTTLALCPQHPNNCPDLGGPNSISPGYYYSYPSAPPAPPATDPDCLDFGTLQIVCDTSLECSSPGTHTCWEDITFPKDPTDSLCLGTATLPRDVVCANNKDPSEGGTSKSYSWWVRDDPALWTESSLSLGCSDGFNNDCNGGCDEFGCDGIPGGDPGDISCDGVAPITTSSYAPPDGTNGYYVSNVDVTLSCDDEGRSGCATTWYCFDASGSCTPNIAYSGSFTIASEGSITLRFYSVDLAGNSETPINSETLMIDTSYPNTSADLVSSIGPNTLNWYQDDVTVTLTCNDVTPGSGCFNIDICGDLVNTCSPNFAISGPFTLTAEGIVFIRFNSTDNAGNVEPTNFSEIKIDKTNATISDNYTFDGVWTLGNYTVNLTPFDSGAGASGINWVRYCEGGTCDPSTGTDLTYPYYIHHETSTSLSKIIRYQTIDFSGRVSPIGEYNVSIYSGDATSYITSPANHTWVNANGFNVNVYDFNAATCEYRIESAGTQTFPITPGTWVSRTCGSSFSVSVGSGMDCRNQGLDQCRVYVRGTNGVGQVNVSYAEYHVDWVPPNLYSFSSLGSCNMINNICWIKPSGTWDFEIKNEDNLSGVFSHEMSFTLNCEPGSCPAGDQVTSYYDTIPSYIELLQNDSLISILGGACVFGLCSPTYMETQWAGFSGSAEVNTSVWIALGDVAGNAPYQYSGINVSIDGQPPTGTILINGGNAFTTSTSVTLTLSSGDLRSGIPAQGCKYWDSDGIEPSVWESCVTTKPWTLLDPDELKTVYQKIRDNVGYETTVSATITLDRTVPSAVITSPPNESWHPQSGFTTIVEDLNVDNCEYRIESGGIQTLPVLPAVWQTRTCNNPVAISSGPGGDCDLQGENVCEIFVKSQNSGTGIWSPTTSKVYSLDWVAPSCTMSTLNTWSYFGFFLNWSGSDNFGIQNYSARIFNGSEWEPINETQVPVGCDYLNNTDPFESAQCFLSNEGETYNFSCHAIDLAGNIGPWSENVTTTIDLTDPIPILNFSEWINNESGYWSGNQAAGSLSFDFDWNVVEVISGLQCVSLQWNFSGSWEYITYNGLGDDTNCTLIQNLTFGPQFPITVQEGVTYQYRINAKDNANRTSQWFYGNSTIDLTDPEVSVRPIFMTDGLNLESNATDNISGVLIHNLSWISGLNSNFRLCPPGLPFGGTSICSDFIQDEFSADVLVNVTDRAGNNILRGFSFGKIVNFRKHFLNLILGNTEKLLLDVLNPETSTDNITLFLQGTYPSQYFRFIDFGAGNFSISPDRRTMEVFDVQPSEKRTFVVEVVSIDVYSSPRTVEVDGFMNTSLRNNTDSVSVLVTYPPSFSGLTDATVLILIMIAVSIYHFRRQ